MRILTVIGMGKLGGAETFFVTLNRAFRRAGHTVHAAQRPSAVNDKLLEDAGIPNTRLPWGGRYDFWSKYVLGGVMRKFRPDVVLSFAGWASERIPPGDYPVIGRLGGYHRLECFKRCHHLVCNAPQLVRYAADGGYDPARIHLIPNFPNLQDSPKVDRASLNTPEGAPLALALGRLHPSKEHDILIKAAAQIPELYVWIAGEGDQRAMLEALARDLNVAERVKFLGWRTDRAGLFKAADVCVFPSRVEPFGNVAVEAWGYGSPLVAARANGPAWLARDREDALLVPIDDPDALAVAIREVIGSRALAETLVRNGRKRVAAEFSEEAVVAQYIDVFHKARAEMKLKAVA